jgi:hypothetical protein
LEYLQEQLKFKKFSDIKDTVWGRRIHTTQIVVNVIDPQTPVKVKFDIFKRINTLGEPLTSQEIRHCMSQQTSRDFLKACANSAAFLTATCSSMINHKRMADREAVLRFCAFRMLNQIEDYDSIESMEVFLSEATEKLDLISDQKTRDKLSFDLERACENATRLFGEHAFRKWGTYESRKNPINKALLEVWTVNLANFEWSELEPRREAIIAAARKAMTQDWAFIDAISAATGDPRKVKLRFRFIRTIIELAGLVEQIPESKTLVNPVNT